MRFTSFFAAVSSLALGASAYWLEDITHQGLAPYAGGSNYTVFRNVKDYGAVGDGSTDDTNAILDAMNAGGNRCMQGCASTTETPAVVYFPSGTYIISSSIITPYYTQMIGDPTDRPVLKGTADFAGFGLIDGNPYYTEDPNWVTTNVFFRQIHNFVLDTTNIAAGTAATGMHWPSSQATSLQNIEFNMAEGADSVHVGLFIENGSGGFMADLTFNGGATGASLGNQQYTMRNFTFNNCQKAIIQIWNWGWTYVGLNINNCPVGIEMGAGGPGALEVGSVNVLDSTISNVENFMTTNYTDSSTPSASNGITLENVVFDTVTNGVTGPDGVVYLEGGSKTVAAWGQGHQYTGTGANGTASFQGEFDANTRPSAMLDGDNWLLMPKPRYEDLTVDDFMSARDAGAVGDGETDDTAAIQKVIDDATSAGKVVYLDYGLYKVTDTITVPAGAKIIGESFPAIMGSGDSFNDQTSPKVVFQVGTDGETGRVEIADMIVSTKGPAQGAIIVEVNMVAPEGNPSGFWEFHTRIGGYAGSEFQLAQCPKAPGSSNIDDNCIAAYMAVHIAPAASGVYLENTWLWAADHDIEDPDNTQITIFSGRGIYVESTDGLVWLIGGASEHHHLYNYQFASTKNIFASMLQTETPYYMPLPDATEPFTVNTDLKDPDYTTSCEGVDGNCAETWGLRVLDTSDVFIYGAGHYSFFNNFDTSCNTFENGSNCQTRIVSMEGDLSNINIFGLSTVGVTDMITQDGTALTTWEDNVSTFAATVMMWRSG